MLSTRSKTVFFILLLLGNFLLHTLVTSADIFAERRITGNKFTATTLTFSLQHTANSRQRSTLFTVDGLLPDGFDVAAVRVKNDGKSDFKYHLKTVKKNGDDALCNALKLQLTVKGQEKYSGPLMSLGLDSQLKATERDDWVIFLSLDNSNKALASKSCDFNFFFNTWKIDPNEKPAGFHAERTLTNTVNSGTW